ncbi:MAG: hypothetical protein ACRCUY_02100 [Thermoguttaceae bacterium]
MKQYFRDLVGVPTNPPTYVGGSPNNRRTNAGAYTPARNVGGSPNGNATFALTKNLKP